MSQPGMAPGRRQPHSTLREADLLMRTGSKRACEGGDTDAMDPRRSTLMLMLVGALAYTGACASAGGSQVFVVPDLEAEELEPYADLTVYDFLRRHTKVTFIRRQGGSEAMYAYTYGGSASLSQGGVLPSLLWLDGQEILNPVEELKRIPVERVQRLEILKATEYSSRYGGPGRHGAVVITTKGGSGG